MEKNHEFYADILRKHNITVIDGTITNMRFHAMQDWYVETEDGWFWWSGTNWKYLPYGPTLY